VALFLTPSAAVLILQQSNRQGLEQRCIRPSVSNHHNHPFCTIQFNMLAALPEYHPFFDPFPQPSLSVNYHDLPISNPAVDDDDDDGSAYADADGNANLSSDDDMEYEDDDEAADDDQCRGKDDGEDDGEDDDAPAYLPSIEDVPDLHRTLIEEALQLDWDIDSPQDFQVISINQGAYNDNTVIYLISKTGSGKSAVPLTIATLRCGITIFLVPLLGLGSDQVKKASREERGIRAYHVDEHRGADGVLLRDWLMNMTDDECETSTTILFISPQSLSDHVNPKTNINVPSPWLTCIRKLALKDRISLMCIDEAFGGTARLILPQRLPRGCQKPTENSQ
jgi:hypothetical protein